MCLTLGAYAVAGDFTWFNGETRYYELKYDPVGQNPRCTYRSYARVETNRAVPWAANNRRVGVNVYDCVNNAPRISPIFSAEGSGSVKWGRTRSRPGTAVSCYNAEPDRTSFNCVAAVP